MISGQAPNPATSSDCQSYRDFNGPTEPRDHRPATARPSAAAASTRRTSRRSPTSCQRHHISWARLHGPDGQHPVAGAGAVRGPDAEQCGGIDDTQSATAARPVRRTPQPVRLLPLADRLRAVQAARRHPDRTCAPRSHRVKTTPRFSFITPDLCDDGHDSAVRRQGRPRLERRRPGRPSTISCRTWIPRIEALARVPEERADHHHLRRVRDLGRGELLQRAAWSDRSAARAVGPGGGRIGTLVIGHCVRRGARDPTPLQPLLAAAEPRGPLRHHARAAATDTDTSATPRPGRPATRSGTTCSPAAAEAMSRLSGFGARRTSS